MSPSRIHRFCSTVCCCLLPSTSVLGRNKQHSSRVSAVTHNIAGVTLNDLIIASVAAGFTRHFQIIRGHGACEGASVSWQLVGEPQQLYLRGRISAIEDSYGNHWRQLWECLIQHSELAPSNFISHQNILKAKYTSSITINRIII